MRGKVRISARELRGFVTKYIGASEVSNIVITMTKYTVVYNTVVYKIIMSISSTETTAMKE